MKRFENTSWSTVRKEATPNHTKINWLVQYVLISRTSLTDHSDQTHYQDLKEAIICPRYYLVKTFKT